MSHQLFEKLNYEPKMLMEKKNILFKDQMIKIVKAQAFCTLLAIKNGIIILQVSNAFFTFEKNKKLPMLFEFSFSTKFEVIQKDGAIESLNLIREDCDKVCRLKGDQLVL